MKKNKKLILITGVAGMIGSELAGKLLKIKTNRVIGIDNFILGNKQNMTDFISNKNFQFFKKDLSKKINNTEIKKILKNHKIAEVWHLAANSDIRSGIYNSNVDLKNTFLSTYYILDFIKNNIDHKTKFIFTSSSAVFGENKIKINEKTPALYACSNYGSMKLASEAIISSFSYLNNIKSLIFRLPNVVGKNLTHGVVYDLSNKIKNKNIKFLQVLGNGMQCKPYSYASEVIECMSFIKIKKQSKFINYYNIGNNDKGVTVKEIVKLLVKKYFFKKKIKFQKNKFGWKGDIPQYKYSTKKINRLGYKFSISSMEAIKKTLIDLKD